MFSDFTDLIQFAGRLLIGGAFVFAGLRNIQNRALLTGLMTARGVPQAGTALWLGIVLQVAAGALMIAGVRTGYATLGLIAFLIVATPIFHNFWNYQGTERGAKINGVVGNIALLGGLLVLVADL